MKKLLISVITILLVVLIIITAVKGIKIGGLEILGIPQIKNKNDNLDQVIQEATKLSSTDYKNQINKLTTTLDELKKKREEYSDQVSVSTDSEVQASSFINVYDIDMLWTTIGNYAKTEGVAINMVLKNIQEVTEESTAKTASEKKYTCDLNFTANGAYVGIEEFLTDIEDDSNLGFRIENFKMIPSAQNGSVVEATFNCTNITVKGITTTSSQTSSGTEKTITDTNQNNTVNNTTNTEGNTVGNTTENTTNTVNR